LPGEASNANRPQGQVPGGAGGNFAAGISGSVPFNHLWPVVAGGGDMIYRTFEQWKSGNVLEHGVPRIEHYSEDQLDLVEMGWNYGYDAGRAVEQALDKKAENARELGLDYEPHKGLSEHLAQATNGRVRIDPVTGNVGIGTQPAAQRTWVGLSQDELDAMFSNTIKGKKLVNWVALAIEAKLKEKNA
jgi:hypothetical protein